MLQLITRLIAFFKSERDDKYVPHESLQDDGMTYTELLQKMNQSHIRYLKRRLSYWKCKPKKTIHRLQPQIIVKMP